MKQPLFFLVFILIINLFSLYYRWYLNYSWSDQILHFSGGFFVAMLFSVYLKNHLLNGARIKNTLILVGAVALIGVIWEFSEYIANQTLIEPVYRYFKINVYFVGDLDDTLNDLLMDILGASLFVISLLHPFWRRKTHKV